VLTEAQVIALEKAKTEKGRTANPRARTRVLRGPGYVLVGNLKGVGRI